MKPVKPWPANTECPLEGFLDFKNYLNQASYYHAADNPGEWRHAAARIKDAARIAVLYEWPYWAMDRMFREIQPLVAWDAFMQAYINVLRGN
jgi:hypothetical protein